MKDLSIRLSVQKLLDSVKYDKTELIGKDKDIELKTFTYQPEPIEISKSMVEDFITTTLERDPEVIEELLLNGESVKSIVGSILENGINDIYERDFRGFGSEETELEINTEDYDDEDIQELLTKYGTGSEEIGV